MATTLSGTVYPVFNNKFMIRPLYDLETGKLVPENITSKEDPGFPLALNGMESFSVALDNGVEEFNTMEQEGWVKRLMTAKGYTVSLGGKRLVGDKGNDTVAKMAFTTGVQSLVDFYWLMVDDKTVLHGQCVLNVSSLGGDSTAIDALEVELQSDGKPEWKTKEDYPNLFPSAPEVLSAKKN